MRHSRTYVVIALLVLSSVGTADQIKNWRAPSTWSPASTASDALLSRVGGRSPLAAPTYPPLPFIPLPPCRLADTRGNGFTGVYGTPQLVGGGAARSFPIPSNPTCTGIPADAAAFSLNFTVVAPPSTPPGGYLTVFPTGGAQPVVSTLNFGANSILANAAIVPAGTSGGVSVFVNFSTDLIIDINGFYGPTPADVTRSFVINTNSSNPTMRLTNSSTGCTGACGLYQTVGNGTAIQGDTNSTTGDPAVLGRGLTVAIGVKGVSQNYNGVWAESTFQDGLFASGGRDGAFIGGARYGAFAITSSTTDKLAGVFGVDGAGAGTSAATYSAGVRGEGKHGVVGITNTVTGAGVFAQAVSPGSFGVYAIGGAPNDVAGVFGKDATGAGVATGFLSAGVRGEGKNGVVGITNTLGGGIAGVFGLAISPGQFGVIGISSSSAGAGVAGEALSPGVFGVFAFGELGATGAKPFVEPHPTDPALTIRYVALEGPEAGTYFRGTAQTRNGIAVIPVPETFRIVTDDAGLTVQVTAAGRTRIWVESEDLREIVVRSDDDVRFHYHVNGVRRAFKDWQVVAEGSEYRPAGPDQKMPSWLTEEAKRRLVSNGTYNPDGTVNMATAERLGWAKTWREEVAGATIHK